MARPKKAPRDRIQITLSKPIARKLRAYCKRNDIEISAAIEKAVGRFYLFNPPEKVADIDQLSDRSELIV